MAGTDGSALVCSAYGPPDFNINHSIIQVCSRLNWNGRHSQLLTSCSIFTQTLLCSTTRFGSGSKTTVGPSCCDIRICGEHLDGFSVKLPNRMTKVFAEKKGHRSEASRAERLIIFSHGGGTRDADSGGESFSQDRFDGATDGRVTGIWDAAIIEV
jgi:hypothetical protein